MIAGIWWFLYGSPVVAPPPPPGNPRVASLVSWNTTSPQAFASNAGNTSFSSYSGS